MKHYSILESLGFVGAIITILGLIAVFLFIERLSYINKITIDTVSFVEGILNLLKFDKRNEALTLCEETTGPIASITRTYIMHDEKSDNNIELQISSLSSIEIRVLSKSLDLLKFLSFLSSCVGLVGTLLSVYKNFDILVKNNSVLDPHILLTFFTYAVNTSIFGFLVAILIFIFYTYLRYRIKLIIYDMEWSAYKFAEFITYN